MKTDKQLIKLLFFTTFCYILFSCHSGPFKVESFTIKVDSIHLPSTIVSKTPFDIQFFGTVGTSGCYKFETYSNTITGNEIAIEAKGSFDSWSGTCPTVMVYLDSHKLNMTITSSGIYTIKIKEPDNTFLVKQINVL
jgi:hypothetical protein